MGWNTPMDVTDRMIDEASPGYWDETPEQWTVCADCDGEGAFEEPEPPPDDPFRCRVVVCSRCNGAGGWID